MNRSVTKKLNPAILGLSLVSSIFLTNCGTNNNTPTSQNPNLPSGVQSIEVLGSDTAAQLVAQGRTGEAANYYVNLAELLLNPDGMTYADDMLDRALRLAPNHAKANFLSALVKPWLVFKGFKTRGLNLWQEIEQLSTPVQIEDLNSWFNKKIARPHSELLSQTYPKMNLFLKAPVSQSKVFRNYEDAQGFFSSEVDAAIAASIQSLEKVKQSGETFTFKLDENAWGKNNVDYFHNARTYCYQWGMGHVRCENYDYSYFNRELVPVQTVTVGPTEARVMLNASKGLAAANKVASAFSLKGLDAVVLQLKEIQGQFNTYNRSVPTKQIVQLLQGQSDLFTIRSSHKLSQIPSDAEEILREVIDLKAMRNGGCDQSHSFFRSSYICMATEKTSQQLSFALSALSGPVSYTLGHRRSGEPITLTMNIPAALRNPISDLKQLLPNQFYRTGQAANYPDPTMGGLFPDGDLLLKLSYISR